MKQVSITMVSCICSCTVYLSVPLITPPVSVVPVINGQQISLNISINVSIITISSSHNSKLTGNV